MVYGGVSSNDWTDHSTAQAGCKPLDITTAK